MPFAERTPAAIDAAQPLRRPLGRLVSLLIGGTLSITCFAQNTPEPLKNFKKYPDGQWTQELTGSVSGQAATPTTSQGCKSPATPQNFATAQKLNNAFATLCNTVKVSDTERQFEYEQTCKLGGTGTQVTRITGRVVDDHVMTVDTRMSVKDHPDTLTHAKMTYTGATCTATAPSTSKPSAAECAQVNAMQSESANGADVCASMPAQYRAQCETRVTAGRNAQAAVAARCK